MINSSIRYALDIMWLFPSLFCACNCSREAVLIPFLLSEHSGKEFKFGVQLRITNKVWDTNYGNKEGQEFGDLTKKLIPEVHTVLDCHSVKQNIDEDMKMWNYSNC